MAQQELKAGGHDAPSPIKRSGSVQNASGETGDGETVGRKPTSFARFMRDVGIIGALLIGGMYFYRQHITTKEEVSKLILSAEDKLEKDDLASLKEAEGIYKQILQLDGDNERGLVGLAESYFYQSQHGLPTRDQSEQYVKQAGNSERPELAAVQAYLKITGGGAQGAETEIKALLDKGVGSSKLAHALGWSYLEQGNFIQANQVVRAALDTDFNAVRFALTLAEVAHRQGEERAAVRHLRNATQSAMNPSHEIALAWLAALSAKNYGNIVAPAKAIQDVQARKDKIGPRAEAMLAWAEGELSFATGNPGGAIEKADAALALVKDFPPFLDLKARALFASKKVKEAIEIYELAVKAKPEYRGIKKDYIEILTAQKDDRALALIEELQKSVPAAATPEFEIMRAEFYLAKGDLAAAKKAYEASAELGDDPAILFGLAKVAFEEEKKKEKKADLERVGEAIQHTLERRATYPEVQEYLAKIELWNFNVDGAKNTFGEAETQYKKLNRPVPAMVRFYDSVVEQFGAISDKSAKGAADKAITEWQKKKKEYLDSVVNASAEG